MSEELLRFACALESAAHCDSKLDHTTNFVLIVGSFVPHDVGSYSAFCVGPAPADPARLTPEGDN